MFLRPGNLLKNFILERCESGVNDMGRLQKVFKRDSEPFRCVLGSASPHEKEQYGRIDHPVSHTIVHRGRVRAKEGDRFLYGDRAFYVQAVDGGADLGIATVYYAEERSGTYELGR